MNPLIQQAVENVRTNKLASRARIAGRYTPDGMVTAAQEAELNGMDRVKMKQMMMGLGGTMTERTGF